MACGGAWKWRMIAVGFESDAEGGEDEEGFWEDR